MPVRFRCPHCNRLLGIARRKAGTQVNCPQCDQILTVPQNSKSLDLDEIDQLVNPVATPQPDAASAVQVTHKSVTGSAISSHNDIRLAPSASKNPLSQQARATPSNQHDRQSNRDSPLLERDVDSLLGLDKVPRFELDGQPDPRTTRVTGIDALSLGDEPEGIVLSPQKFTLLALGVLILLGLAFAAGFLTASAL